MKKMGRPKGENNKNNTCSIRMDDKTLKRLELYCEKMQMQKSDVIREAIFALTEEEDDK